MLPDLRILAFATVSTFLVTVCAGLFASIHILPDPIKTVQPDRDTPISRVALSWQDIAARPSIPDLHFVAIRRDATEASAPIDNTLPKIEPAAAPEIPADPAPAKADEKPAAPEAAQEVKPETDAAPAPVVNTEPAKADPQQPAPEKKNLAARTDPAEITPANPAPKAATHSPARPKVRRSKPEPRAPRRSRILRTDNGPGQATASDPGNFFTDFGSRMTR